MMIIKMYFLCLIVSALILAVKSFQPNCYFETQFRFYNFPVEFCNDYMCDSSDDGIYFPSSNLVRIKDTKIIPTCAFTNSDKLRDIDGVNKKIEIIASKSFINLPNLRNILLSFNLIRELHHGIFLGVSSILLDLSWNKIAYIHDDAFQGLTRLEYLNLSKNELKTLPNTPMPSGLIELKLAYNFFDRILMTTKKTPYITDIDISNNMLERTAFHFENTVKKLDLSNNVLETIDFLEIPTCEELKIRSNLFSKVPDTLKHLNMQRVSLHRNPWLCKDLKTLYRYLLNNNVVVVKEDIDETESECQANLNTSSNIYQIRQINERRKCQYDEDCNDHMICRSNTCWNPCSENACDSTSYCKVKHHRFKCTCPDNLRKNPKILYSVCLNVRCFSKSDCKEEEECSRDNICVVLQNLQEYSTTTVSSGHDSKVTPISDFLATNVTFPGNAASWWRYEISSKVKHQLASSLVG